MKKAISILAIIGILLTTGFSSQQAQAKSDHDKKGHHETREANQRTKEQKENEREDNDDNDDHDKYDEHNKQQWTNLQRVEKDKQALAIDYGGSDTAESVTVPFDSLPNHGVKGSIISWISSNTAVISNDGKIVNRPSSSDILITLTATLKYGDASATKSFTVNVKMIMTDSEKVAADKNVLILGFSTGDTAGSLTGPLTLAATGQYGSSIIWQSSAPAIISNDGKIVNRPVTGSGDAAVVLTAFITSHNISDVKIFQVIVKQQSTDAQRVAADKAILAVGFQTGDSAGSVTHPLVLTTIGANGSTISWTSNNTALISNNGTIVNRPTNGSGDASIVLTATITSNASIDLKAFNLIVKQQLTDVQKVAADKAALTIGFKSTDTADNVTGPLTLPTLGWNGSTIIWISNNEPVLSSDGKILVRPNGANNVQVTFTAFIISGVNTDMKNFTVTVIHL
jgi:uncharacterized membrane protein